MAVSSIQSGQIWRSDDTKEAWVVTRVYREALASYAVLRKAGAEVSEARRVKVERSPEGPTLPGFTLVRDPGSTDPGFVLDLA